MDAWASGGVSACERNHLRRGRRSLKVAGARAGASVKFDCTAAVVFVVSISFPGLELPFSRGATVETVDPFTRWPPVSASDWLLLDAACDVTVFELDRSDAGAGGESKAGGGGGNCADECAFPLGLLASRNGVMFMKSSMSWRARSSSNACLCAKNTTPHHNEHVARC